MNSFLKMRKSSLNVKNVFEGSPLTGHGGCLELWQIFNTFFNISSHIQRFWMEITKSSVSAEIYVWSECFFQPGQRKKQRVPQNLDNPKNGQTLEWG